MPVRLFVGNLPYEVNEAELRAHFAPAGPLYSVFIPIDRATGKPRGFAFIEFNEQREADEAIRLFHQQAFKGRSLAVNEARPKEARPPGPRPFTSGGPPSMGSSMPRMGPPRSGPPPAPFEDPAARGDKSRRFGPNAKPKSSRQFRPPKFEGKKPLKERLSGRIYGVDDLEDDAAANVNVDDFATSLGEDDAEDSNQS